MAGPITYNELKAQKSGQDMAAQAANNQAATRQGVQGEVAGSKNAALQRAMSTYGNEGGLGQIDPGPAVMQATNAAQGFNTQEEYDTAMIDAVGAGKADPRVVLEDPNMSDMAKEMLLGLLQGGPQDTAPAGLGQVR